MGRMAFVPEGQADRSQARRESVPQMYRPVGYGMIRVGVAHRFDMAHISTRHTSGIGCARSYRTLRDGS
jgi:hypothetical protein